MYKENDDDYQLAIVNYDGSVLDTISGDGTENHITKHIFNAPLNIKSGFTIDGLGISIDNTVDGDDGLCILDSKNNIICNTGSDGIDINAPLRTNNGVTIQNTVISSRLDDDHDTVLLDSDDKILESIDADGKHINCNLEINGSVKINGRIDFSNNSLSNFESDLKDKGFNLNSGTGDWSDAVSLEIPIPRLAMINIIAAIPTSKIDYEYGDIEFWDMAGNYFKKPMAIALQGNSAVVFPKKSFKFDLFNNKNDEDDTFKIKFGTWVARDGFHLKAYQTDRFRGIAVCAYQLFDEVWRTRGIFNDRAYKRDLIDFDNIPLSDPTGNLPELDIELQTDSGARCFPDGFPCILYFNGDFYGVFSLQLSKHRSNMMQDKNTAEHIHFDGHVCHYNIFNGEISWNRADYMEIRNPKNLYCMDGIKYDADTHPNEFIDATSPYYDSTNKNHVRSAQVKKYLIGFSQIIPEIKALNTQYESNHSSNTLNAIKAAIEKYFYVDELIDYLIVSDFIFNHDGVRQNWQWHSYIKAQGESNRLKWHVSPYDLDLIVGYGLGGALYTISGTSHVREDYYMRGENKANHILFYIVTYYKTELETRYKELRDSGLLTVSHFIDLLNQWCGRIGVDNYKKEFKKWPLGEHFTYNGQDMGERRTGANNDSIYRVAKWLTNNLNRLDSLYNYTI